MGFSRMSSFFLLCFMTLSTLFVPVIRADDGNGDPLGGSPLSPQTQACVGCHKLFTPGIVRDWMTSRHSKTTPAEAMQKSPIEKRISVGELPSELSKYAVGCFECHSRNPALHKDNFAHMGYRINVVVSPNDCKTCHPAEAEQFAGSKKAKAYGNLMDNAVYRKLVDTVTGIRKVTHNRLVPEKPSADTLRETCLGCHGTKVEVKGMKNVSVKVGNIAVPDLTNWPNQGVGRLNPDGTVGTCSACHPRHGFLIEVARKPYTCGECHHEPDVPAWEVYEESKHGNIFSSKASTWDFTAVPWKIGKDFKAPTCAVCHNSLIVSADDKVVIERSHDFGSRLWVRLFGLIYSHPQPKQGDTTIIRNKEGQPLPLTFTGQAASEYLIDSAEQQKRLSAMSGVCNNCHGTDWIEGHFEKLATTTKETDQMVLAATELVTKAWEEGIADGSNPFDESIEQMWIRQWLFYPNSIRYASAMTGAPDYTAFKNGWWYLNENLQHMKDWMVFKRKPEAKKEDR